MPDFKTIADFRKNNGKAMCRVCRLFCDDIPAAWPVLKALVAIDESKFKTINNRDRHFIEELRLSCLTNHVKSMTLSKNCSSKSVMMALN